MRMQLVLIFAVLACGCGSAAVVDLAQHYAAPFQLVPESDGASVGAVSVRGLGFSGHGHAAARFVHHRTVLFEAHISVDGCAGLELVASNDALRLDRVSGAEAARIWPALSCGGETARRSIADAPRVTLCTVGRTNPQPCPGTLAPPLLPPPPPPPPPPARASDAI